MSDELAQLRSDVAAFVHLLSGSVKRIELLEQRAAATEEKANELQLQNQVLSERIERAEKEIASGRNRFNATTSAESKADDKTVATTAAPTPGAATATADSTKKNDAPSASAVLKAPPYCNDAGFLTLVSETKDIDKITHLHLGGNAKESIDCKITNKTLEFIAATFPQLVGLDLQCSKRIGDAGLEHLSKLSGITLLDLSGCDNITDADLEHISKLSRITSLNVHNCSRISDAGLQHLSKLSRITSLNLSDCYRITDAGLEHIAKLSGITSLDLSRCKRITDAGLEHISNLSRITSLNLAWCGTITDAGLEHLSSLSRITSLNLDNCCSITDTHLEHLSKLSGMTSLVICGHEITAEAKEKFNIARPNCIIDFRCMFF